MIRDLASLSLLAVIGLSCVVSEPKSDDTIGETAMASESGFMSETGTESESGSTSETTGTETSTSESESGSETGSESGTDTGTSTETGTETGTETESTETGMEGPTPDLGVLAIIDVNPNSATYNQKVHPLDYEGQLSGWYFGHAT